MILDIKGTLFGDTDLNQTVDFSDFLALSEAFGGEGGWAQGDFDGSGDIAFPDFLALSDNFGSSVAASPATVPEPSTLTFAVFALFVLPVIRRRRNR